MSALTFDLFKQIHQHQLSSIPSQLWEKLYTKLLNETFDIGSIVELRYDTNGYALHIKDDVNIPKDSDVFLVDHAWTNSGDPVKARQDLMDVKGLLERMESLMDIEPEESEEEEESGEEEEEEKDHGHDDETVKTIASIANTTYHRAQKILADHKGELINALAALTMNEEQHGMSDTLNQLQTAIQGQLPAEHPQKKNEKSPEEKEKEKRNARVDRVLETMWKYLQTYEVLMLDKDGNQIKQVAWYVMDEVGSAIRHSSTPNAVCIPFIFNNGQGIIPFNVLYFTQDLNGSDMVTRDFIPKGLFQSELDKKAYLNAFFEESTEELESHYKSLANSTNANTSTIPSPPPLPSSTISLTPQPQTTRKPLPVIKVYTNMTYVRNFLPHTHVVDDPEKADLIWILDDFGTWGSWDETLESTKQIINQFPGEECLTQKSGLAKLINACYKTGDDTCWPQSFVCPEEVAAFVGKYLNGKDKDDNLWIVKPANFSRGMGIFVSPSLPRILRQMETKPIVVQKYISDPCLYKGYKFDLRYIILLTSLQPLKCYVYKMFWIRIGNKAYTLSDFDDYEKHFTVMNYNADFQMKQLLYTDFIRNFNSAESVKWDVVQGNIDYAMKSALHAAAVSPAPLGLKAPVTESNPNRFFAIYGVDVMVSSAAAGYTPKILEINFNPDCTRACQYDKYFSENILGQAMVDLGKCSADDFSGADAWRAM